jgi:hypothetical protein
MKDISISGEAAQNTGRRGFLMQTLVGGTMILGGAAACSKQEGGGDNASAKELAELKALYSNPDKAPITHVRGQRMGRELLTRLEFSRKQTHDPKVLSEIDRISDAIKLGDKLVSDGELLCW